MTFGAAYYGPNASLFGNISNSYWAFIAIKDVHQMLQNMIMYFLADFSSLIISASVLWYYCHINIFKVFLGLQQEFWPGFSVLLGGLLVMVGSESNSYNITYFKNIL